MSKARAAAMLKAWRDGRSNIPQWDTEEFERQYELAVNDSPWAFVPSIGAFDGIGGADARREWYQRVCAYRASNIVS
jgi:hypothetical protein